MLWAFGATTTRSRSGGGCNGQCAAGNRDPVGVLDAAAAGDDEYLSRLGAVARVYVLYNDVTAVPVFNDAVSVLLRVDQPAAPKVGANRPASRRRRR